MTQEAEKPETKKPSYIVHEDIVYKATENAFYRAWDPCDVKQQAPEPEWLRSKIPLAMWQDMKAFCQVSYKIFDAETLIQLFFDPETDRWSWWVVPQLTKGMAVEARDKAPEYIEQRKRYKGIMAGTLHHHCAMGAFQSGTDSADELDKDGVHFTIGSLKSDEFSIHARFVHRRTCRQIEAQSMIEADFGPAGEILKPEALGYILNRIMRQPLSKESLKSYDFTEDLKNVRKPVQSMGRSASNHPNFRDWRQKGWGDDGFVGGQQSLGLKEPAAPKEAGPVDGLEAHEQEALDFFYEHWVRQFLKNPKSLESLIRSDSQELYEAVEAATEVLREQCEDGKSRATSKRGWQLICTLFKLLYQTETVPKDLTEGDLDDLFTDLVLIVDEYLPTTSDDDRI